MGNNNDKNDYVKSESAGMINPYTFVPIHEVESRERTVGTAEIYQDKKKLHTGVMKCRLYVKTPIAIPDVESLKDEEHKTYERFYQEGEKPTIPGSSLRGMIRSVYETATDSCFSTMKEDTILTKRSEAGEARFYSPGILCRENEEWILKKATRHCLPYSTFKVVEKEDGKKVLEKDEKLTTGVEVTFQSEKKDRKFVVTKCPAEKGKKGILVLGEPGGKKENESIFEIQYQKNQKPQTVVVEERELENAYERMRQVLYYYRDQAINRNLHNDEEPQMYHSGYKNYDDLSLEKGIPVWYRLEGKGIILSYAAIGRITYKTHLDQLAGERCTDRNHLCEACLLFGMIAGNGKDEAGLGGHVRVTNAVLQGGAIQKPVTLKELAAPRYSYLPFYMKVRDNGQIPESYDDENAEIAGENIIGIIIEQKKKHLKIMKRG